MSWPLLFVGGFTIYHQILFVVKGSVSFSG